MKKRIVLILLAAAMVGVVGYVIAHRYFCRPSQSDLDRLRDVSHLAQSLDLRPDQVKAMEALQNRLCDQLAGCSARHCACRKELAAALIAEPYNAARTQELRESLSRCYVDSEMLALDHIRNLREILDVSQRARFDRMITDQLAGPCGMCTNCGAGCNQPQGARR
jgi:hypothetical protein